jgi:hypothetical protein
VLLPRLALLRGSGLLRRGRRLLPRRSLLRGDKGRHKGGLLPGRTLLPGWSLLPECGRQGKGEVLLREGKGLLREVTLLY